MDKRKVKIICDEKKRVDIERMLIAGGFSVCDDAEFVLIESGVFLSTITGRDLSGERVIIKIEDIEYFESFGHDIFLITTEKERLKISEKMYELEAALPPVFIRIGQSNIVYKKRIRKIIPSLFQRFDLIMDSGVRLRVTRSYYNRFCEALGI